MIIIEQVTSNIFYPTAETKDYNVVIMALNKLQAIFSSSCRNKRLQCYDYGRRFFDQPVNNNLKTYDNIWKIAVGQGNDCTTCCLL